MHQSIADLLDPSRIYTNHMLVSSYVGADSKSISRTGRGRFYTTSVAVRSVFGDADNDSTRRFMANRDDTYVPTPGVARKFDEKKAVADDELRQRRMEAKNTTYGGNGTGSKTKKQKYIEVNPLMPKRGISVADLEKRLNAPKAVAAKGNRVDFKNLFGSKSMNVENFTRNLYEIGSGSASLNSSSSRQVSPVSSPKGISPNKGRSSFASPLPRLNNPHHDTNANAIENENDPATFLSPYASKNNDNLKMNRNMYISSQESLDGGSLGEGSYGELSMDMGDFDVDLNSVSTERSVVNNKYAKFKVSLKAKAHLMEKVTSQRADAYSQFEGVKKRILKQI